MAASIHESLKLHVAPDKFFIEPIDESSELLVIDRVSQEICLQGNNGQIPVASEIRPICGIFGIIKLLAGNYLIVITSKEKVGELCGHPIWKITGTDVISYKRTFLHLTETQVQDNKTYLSMIRNVLDFDSFYFSYSYDITHSLQRLHNTSPEFVSIPLHERADFRFVWNSHLLRELAAQSELNRFTLPIMLGFVSIKPCVVHQNTFDWVLISRRSCFRAGVRYYMRGLDVEGHPANFVETEQMIIFNGHKASLVQTRGSVPLYWSQRPNLRYKPDTVLSHSQSHIDGCTRHFDSQVYNYGMQTIINLLDNKGCEKKLVEGFHDVVSKSGNQRVKYEYFDFHYECRRLRWDRLSILIDRLAADQKKYGYFMLSNEGHLMCTQEGVFRTNCIDCLDRTNVVQSLLARRALEDQLQKMGIFQPGEKVESNASLEYLYKNVWADNADSLAMQYTGTPALKTDYTRTGTRTILGALKDGYVSAIRYYKNNFSDGYRQDSIDLFLGNYIVEESEGVTHQSPLRAAEHQDRRILAVPVVFLISFSMCVFSLLIPSDSLSEQFLYVTFWGAFTVGTAALIVYLGQEFVDKPRLAQKIKTD